jgi:methionyl-tRNA formyltransferase
MATKKAKKTVKKRVVTQKYRMFGRDVMLSPSQVRAVAKEVGIPVKQMQKYKAWW